MRHRLALCAISACAVLTACSTPAPLRDAPIPPAYDAASTAEVDPGVIARWWDTFEDPVLSDFVATGLERNLDLQMALADMRAARAQLRQARLALYPGLDVPVEASRQWIENPLEGEEFAEELGLDDDTITIDNWQVLLQAQWRPDIFGADRTRREAARLQLGAAQAQAMAVRLAIASGVAEAYVQARSLIALSHSLEDFIALARESERVVEGYFRLGEATALDVAAAAADRAALEARRGELGAGLAQASFALDTLMDLPPGTARRRLGEDGTIPLANREIALGQPVELLQRRPDIIAVTAALQAAELSALASRRDLFPQIALAASIGRTGMDIDGLISSQNNLAVIAAQMTFPWLMPANHAAVDIADAEVERGFVQLRQAIAAGLEEVETAAAGVAARDRQQAAMEESVERAAERLALARRTYEVGLANLGDVLEAQQGLIDARQARLDARLALASAQISLYAALGGGWLVPDEAQGVQAVGRALEADPIPDRIRQPQTDGEDG